MVTAVGDTVELEEEFVGEMSNPISFSNSLGLKSFVTAEELRAVAAVPCFLSSYVFCAFFLASTAFTGMVSTIFCKELMGE